jgi:shikimate kinase
MNNNIVLIGFASTGKTTIGKPLAEIYKYSFIDLDEVIVQTFRKEHNQQATCREIYQNRGSDFFLDIEFRALKSIEHASSSVIATGGGAAIQQRNQTILKNLGTVVYLYATPEILLTRMKDKGLPAWLQNDPTLENLAGRWNSRNPVYSSIADIIIDTTHKDIDTVTAEVFKFHEQHNRDTV